MTVSYLITDDSPGVADEITTGVPMNIDFCCVIVNDLHLSTLMEPFSVPVRLSLKRTTLDAPFWPLQSQGAETVLKPNSRSNLPIQFPHGFLSFSMLIFGDNGNLTPLLQ